MTRPARAFLRADVPHSEMLVRLSYFRFDAPRDAGKNQPSVTRHSPDE